MRSTHLDGALILSVGLVYVDVSRGTCRNLACILVERDSVKVCLFIDVGGLEDVVGAVKNNERIAGDIGLQYRVQVS
jgi:hypothetical protein